MSYECLMLTSNPTIMTDCSVPIPISQYGIGQTPNFGHTDFLLNIFHKYLLSIDLYNNLLMLKDYLMQYVLVFYVLDFS